MSAAEPLDGSAADGQVQATVEVELDLAVGVMFTVNSGVRPRRSASPSRSAHPGSESVSWIIRVLT
jgi:hypothetical protein